MKIDDTLRLLSLTQAEINAITSPDTAGLVYNSTSGVIQVYDGAAWINCSNATHTGEVTGGSILTVDPTAISNKASVTAAAGMEVLVNDAGTLKKANASDFLAGGGGGEVNTASNVGVGNGIFKQKTGVDLEFKSIDVGNGITATVFPDNLRLDLSNENKFFGRVETIDNSIATNIEYFTEPQNSTEISTISTYTAGNYLVKISFIGRNTSQNGRLIVIPQVDSTNIFSQPYRREPKDNQDIFYETIQKVITLAAGTHSFQLQFNNDGGGTSRVFEANINVEKYFGQIT